MVLTVSGARQCLDVQRVGGLRILGAGAGPQQALRVAHPRRPVCASAATGQQFAIGAIGSLGHGDAELVVQCRGNLAVGRHVPAADEHRSHRTDPRIEPGRDTPLDAAHISLCGGEILFAGKQQGDIDGNTAIDRFLDRRNAFGECRESSRTGSPVPLVRGCPAPPRGCRRYRWQATARLPSTPSRRRWRVASNTGLNRSAARRRSSSANSINRPSPDLPSLHFLADGGVIGLTAADGAIEDGGV